MIEKKFSGPSLLAVLCGWDPNDWMWNVVQLHRTYGSNGSRDGEKIDCLPC